MSSNLICVLIYSLKKCVFKHGFKDSVVLKLLSNLQKYIHITLCLHLGKLQHLESPILLTKHGAKYFLGIWKIFNITKSTNLACQMRFQEGIRSFNYLIFSIYNHSFFSSYEIAVGKNIRQKLK